MHNLVLRVEHEELLLVGSDDAPLFRAVSMAAARCSRNVGISANQQGGLDNAPLVRIRVALGH